VRRLAARLSSPTTNRERGVPHHAAVNVLPPMTRRFAAAAAAALTFLYLARVSLLPRALSAPDAILMWAVYGWLMACACMVVVARRFSLFWPGVVLVLSTTPGILLTPEVRLSFAKWAGWFILLVAAGPLVQSAFCSAFRRVLWRTMHVGFVVVALASAVWYCAGLPALGYGAFSGVMVQCMLLGPMAGLSVVRSAIAFANGRKPLWAGVGLVSLVPCLLSGSRSAVAATAAGLIVAAPFCARRLGRDYVTGNLIMLVTVAGAIAVVANQRPEVTATLQEKGLRNTRAALWEARLVGFRTHPVIGTGFGMGVKTHADVQQVGVDGEPGSSYLALLSMTGLVGTTAFVLVLVYLLASFVRSSPSATSPDAALVLATGALLLVHGIAEGWILAVGSSFCLLFWLWMGRLVDMLPATRPSRGEGRAYLACSTVTGR
jgi:hypothetical protein